MAANVDPIFQKNPSLSGVILNNASGTTLSTLFNAGSEGALIDNISATNTSTTIDTVITLTFNDGTTDFDIGEVNVPAGSGTDGATPATNLLDETQLPYLQAGGGLPLGANQLLKVNAKVTIAGSDTIDIVAYGGDY